MIESKERSIVELFDLAGQVAIVTGGAGYGYGAQVVATLAELGAKVIITSRDAIKVAAKAEEYCSKGWSVRGQVLELGEKSTVNKLVDDVISEHGKIDILVNNATENSLKNFEDIAVEEWNQLLTANLTGTMLLSRAVGQQMLEQQSGSIINMSSIYGIVAPDQRIYGDSGLDSPLLYAVVKAGLIQMARYLASHWAPHVRVNAISPGGLYSEQPAEFLSEYIQRTPLGRMAGPDDLKGAIAFLASDASAWVTGQNFVVDGGWTSR